VTVKSTLIIAQLNLGLLAILALYVKWKLSQSLISEHMKMSDRTGKP